MAEIAFENLQKTKSTVFIDQRKSIELTGVDYLNDFDTQRISLVTCGNALIIEGNELHITRLSLEKGDVSIIGEITSLTYDDEVTEKQRGLFSKWFQSK